MGIETKKSVKKQVWMSEEDAARLKLNAEAAGCTEAAFMRALIRGYNPPLLPGPDFYDAVASVREMADAVKGLLVKPGLTEHERDFIKREAEKWYLIEDLFIKTYLSPTRANPFLPDEE